ncbi:MAG: hypothetical protein M3310_08115, partial [Actinomycetota bacterium]|nr:hypothetical protein [Actinomycetota bacterium]
VEPVDEQIASLLHSLDGAIGPEPEPEPAPDQQQGPPIRRATVAERPARYGRPTTQPRVPLRRRFGRAQRQRFYRSELFFALTGGAVAVALGILTAFLLSS